jgi:glucose-1-phosphate cytidylyltransferase
MKAVILAGGLGTRLSEETDLIPKPLVEIGGRPILWHIMKMYEAAGIRDFIICGGYKASSIKRYFANYYLEENDVEIDTRTGELRFLSPQHLERWKVTIVDTGLNTLTGGRLKRVRPIIGNETFCMTYGDGVADLNIAETIAFHKAHGKLATITAVPSPGRFGILEFGSDNAVDRFLEKPHAEMGWINGGFFVLEPAVIDFIKDDTTVWERDPLELLAKQDQLRAYRHSGFWKPMDTLRDKRELETLWAEGAPWSRPYL